MGKIRRAPLRVVRVKKPKTLTQKIDRRIQRNSDKKYIESAENGQDASLTGDFFDLSQVVIGTDFDNRSGLRIHPISVEFRYEVTLADDSNLIRVTIFQWK